MSACKECGEKLNFAEEAIGECMNCAARSLAAMPGSDASFSVTQDLVNEIVRRAKASQMGLGDKENSTDLNNYEPPHTTETLALLLVSA